MTAQASFSFSRSDVAPDDLVTLRGGVRVSVTALRLALDLEERGIAIADDGEHLILEPADRVRPDEVPLLRQHRAALKVIARYCQRPAR